MASPSKVRKYKICLHQRLFQSNNQKKLAIYSFLLYQFGLQLFHTLLFQFGIKFYYNCVTGLLTTIIPCSSKASVCLLGILKVVTRPNRAKPKQRRRHKYFMIQLACHKKNLQLKRKIVPLEMVNSSCYFAFS